MSRMPHAFTSNGMCVPDWNDPNFLVRAQALIAALASRYNNDPRLGWVEVGFYGNYGEWQLGGMPAGTTRMTTVNKQALIDMVVKAFSKKRIIQMVNDSVGINYAMSLSPEIGWRQDCLGSSTMGWISGYGTKFLDR